LKPLAVALAVLFLAGLIVLFASYTLKDARAPADSPAPTPVPRLDSPQAARTVRPSGRPDLTHADEARSRPRPGQAEPGSEGGKSLERPPGVDPRAEARVEPDRKLRISGTITNEYGEPMAGVRVIPRAGSAPEALSGPEGDYEVEVRVSAMPSPTLRFLAKGYEEKPLHIKPENVRGAVARRINVQLAPAVGRTLVTGSVRGKDRKPIAGVTLLMRSDRLKAVYTTVSDPSGDFSIPEVKIASDYVLLIRSQGVYRDYFEKFLAPTPEGLQINIVLERLETGRLRGRVVDAEGRPIPHVTLSLRSSQASQNVHEISADEQGYFFLKEALAGALTFTTTGHAVRGVVLSPDSEEDVRLILDLGGHSLRGWVVGDDGSPVAGAQVDLTWQRTNGKLSSSSSRRTVSDSGGRFEFGAFGPDPHMLEVRADGYRPVQEMHQGSRQGSEVEVRLQR